MSYSVSDAQGGFERGEADPRLVLATRDIAELELARAANYTSLPVAGEAEAKGSELEESDEPKPSILDRRYQPDNVFAAVGHFVTHLDLPNITLASIYLAGDWAAASAVEAEIVDSLIILGASGYRTRHIPRDSGEADIVLKIIPEQTQQPGFVALQRIRTFGRATLELIDDSIIDDQRAVLNIRKNAWFTVDIAKLQEHFPEAAMEVNAIIASTMLGSIRLDSVAMLAAYEAGVLNVEWLGRFLTKDSTENDSLRLARAQNKVEDAQIPEGLLFERLLLTPYRQRLWSPMSARAFEVGIHGQMPFVTPAANTYHLSGTRHQPRTTEG